MKIIDEYSHKNGLIILKNNPIIFSDVKDAFTNKQLVFKKGVSSHIKEAISQKLGSLGWADRVKLTPSKLTINFMKKKIGLCLQLGNIARLYADLLKLQYLYNKNIIEMGIIAVPMKIDANKIGNNHAQFERLVKELPLFSDSIYVPILVLGLINE